MESNDTDVHLCLVCNEKIEGLMNYVTHKQSKCSAKAEPVTENLSTDFPTSTTGNTDYHSTLNHTKDDISSFVPDVGIIDMHSLSHDQASPQRNEAITDIVLQSLPTSTTTASDSMSYGLLPNMQSYSEEISNSNNIAVTSSPSMNSLTLDIHQLNNFMNEEFPTSSQSLCTTSPSTDSFFQSLELQSRKSPNKIKTSGNQESRNIYSNLESLSITNFLNNLDFSSDDDISNLPSTDDLVNYLDDDEASHKPPKTHTSGKWKPGEQPQSSYKYHRGKVPGGKWKPGTLLKSSHSASKTYSCTACNLTFRNCHSYSAHCRERSHKSLAQALNKELKNKQDIVDAESINRSVELIQTGNESSRTDEDKREKIILKLKSSISNVGESVYEVEEIQVTENTPEKTQTTSNSVDTKRDNLLPTQHIIQPDNEKMNKDMNTQANESECVSKKIKEQKVPEKHVCNICNKKFQRKSDIVRHLMTPFHRNRSMGHSDNLALLTKYETYIAKLSAYQCQMCSFYFNRHSDLLDHANTREHIIKCHNPIGILTCLLCDVKCIDSDELKDHLKHTDHLKAIEKAKNQKICVIKDVVELKCKFCGLKQNSIKRLRRHILYRHQDARVVPPIKRGSRKQRYPCEECDKTFAYPSALNLHIKRLHVAERPFKCEVCERNFVSKYCLDKHLLTPLHQRKMANDDRANILSIEEALESEEADTDAKMEVNENNKTELKVEEKKSKFNCQACDFIADRSVDLRKHVIDTHKDDLIECKICNCHFLNRKAFRVHCSSSQHQKLLENEGEEGVVECPKCSKKFIDKKWMDLHVEFYHNHISSEGQLVSIYGKNTKVDQLYGEHLKQIENMANDASVSCPECGKFIQCERIVEHLRLHTGEKPFICNLCDKAFIARLSLRRHLMSHVGLSEMICNICNKEFKRYATYRQHIALHKSNETHQCDVCGAEFPLLKQLNLHAARHGEKKYKCTYPGCTWSFVFKNELRTHMIKHTGEKKYLCDSCGYAAGTKSRLQRHKKTHTGERNYSCEYCTYKAGNCTHLKRHMRIHIGSKPFQCPYCSFSCNTHENIRKHILKTKKHEGLPVYPCKFCHFGCNDHQVFRSHLLTVHKDEVTPTGIEKLAEYSGLYVRANDPVKPQEGTQIFLPKERKRMKDTKKSKLTCHLKLQPEPVNPKEQRVTGSRSAECSVPEIEWDNAEVPNIAYNTEIKDDKTSSNIYTLPITNVAFTPPIHNYIQQPTNLHIIMHEHQYQQNNIS